MVWQALAGAALGGVAGGLFGRGKKTTGIGRLVSQQIDAQRRFTEAGVNNFAAQFPRFLQALNASSPAFSTLQNTLLSDVNDTARTARLEQAFADRLGQRQASLGVARSPSSALKSSFAGLQFGEQMRSSAINNLFNFTQGISQPMAMSFLGMSSGMLGSDFGAQQQMMAGQANQQRNQSIISGAMSGFGLGAFMAPSPSSQSFPGAGQSFWQSQGVAPWMLPLGMG